jgi:uncharacterized repeat protein (TIGR03837 family)
MRWDIFCKVIDNFGDIGVCWRLAHDLAERGEQVRLWVDDASALAWMAPAGHANVQVLPWHTTPDGDWRLPPEVQNAPRPDVLIEAFGCEPPGPWLARLPREPEGRHPVWLNLEYLSAEDYVERSHLLPSPVWHGPGAGLRKVFFYPGFTPRTGGLLREPGLIEACAAWQGDAAGALKWLSTLPWTSGRLRPQARRVSLFCYAPSPVGPLLDAWAQTGMPLDVLLTPGQATQAAMAWAATPAGQAALCQGSMQLLPLAATLPQPDFDRLLWSCDLNVVRGEDSAVRALWAGRPHLWDIYRQDDGVHADKLAAFEHRWMAHWPEALQAAVRQAQAALNGLHNHHRQWQPLNTTMAWLMGPQGWPLWQAHQRASRQALATQHDLCSQLLAFVTSAR